MTTTTHTCGGTILFAGGGDQRHLYCDRCGAFAYLHGRTVADTTVPSGGDKAANAAAFDAGDDESDDESPV